MAQAAKTAKLAFPGQTVKLHQEFQIGAQNKNDLGSYLGRVDIVLGSVNNAANLAALKPKGWTDAETTAFQTAREVLAPPNNTGSNPSAARRTPPRKRTPTPPRFTKTC